MRSDPIWQRYWRYLTAAFRRDVRDEVEFHLSMRARELERQGMPPIAARAEAERRFGDPARVRAGLERIEARRGRRLARALSFEELRQDVRYGLRCLVRQPGFTAVTALSLALGIAACTVVLSVVDRWLLRPLPVPHAERLVVVGVTTRATGALPTRLISLPTFRDLADRRDLFDDAAAVQMVIAAARPGTAEQATRGLILAATGTYFRVLGAPPALGRLLGSDDDRLRNRAIVLDHRMWQRDFGGDPGVIGTTVLVNTVPFEVVGVAAPEVQGAELLFEITGYVPAGSLPAIDPTQAGQDDRRAMGRYKVLARLRPGVSAQQAQQALDVLAAQLLAGAPELGEGFRFQVVPESRSRPTLESSGGMLVAGIGFSILALLVLVTAAVNATNLLLARGSTRQTELAVRQALGAARGRVVRQLITETMLVTMLGLAASWLLARFGVRALASIPIAAGGLRIALDLAIDWRVFGLATLLTVLVGLLAGAGPALALSRFDLQQRLRAGARAALGSRGHRVRSGLVVLQVAGSMVVLVTAALFWGSARQATRVDIGFRPDSVVMMDLDATLARLDEREARVAFERIREAAASVPGVRAAAWTDAVPLSTERSAGAVYEVETERTGELSKQGTVTVFASTVSPEYFDVLDVPLLEGRGFTPADDTTSRLVAIVNTRAAEMLWANRSPIGRTLALSRNGPPIEVVGVVTTGRYLLIGEAPRPYLYLPVAQRFAPARFLVASTTREPALVAPRLAEAVAAIHPDLTPFGVRTLSENLANSPSGLLLPRVGSVFAMVIGGLALILTCVGLYGVVAYSVAQRTREIGLRMALGATRGAVVQSVLVQGGRLVLAGVALGIGAAMLAARSLGSLMIGVSAADGWPYAGAAMTLGIVAVLAAYLPARRAAGLDPLHAVNGQGGSA